MSLNLALASAVSSILTLEKQMAVASNNIANANTTGYSKQTVEVTSKSTAGVGTGVSSKGVTINVDKYLLASIVAATSSSSAADTYDSYYSSLQSALGTISSSNTGGNDLTSELSTLESDLTSLSNNPEQSSLKTTVIADLDNITANLRSTSTTIQDQRSQADQEISDTCDDINTQLSTIRSMNVAIAQANALGESTASYEDQRNSAVQSLSEDLGISYFVDGNDQMQVYTTSGQTLLDGPVQYTVSHAANTAISSSTTYASGSIAGVMVGSTDLTSDLASGGGKLGALINLRDTDLPAAQSELDSLASTLSTAINAAYNSGTANPATSPVTGSNTTAFAGTDAVTVASGTTVRIAMVDSSGDIQSYQDVNLSGATSINDVVTDINTAFGATVASLNADGQLVLTSNVASTGVSVATVSGSVDGTNFSAYFHLNDLVSGGTSASTISVASQYLATPSLMSTATLNTGSGTVPFSGLTSGDGSVATALTNALLASQSFSASGHLAATSKTFANYASAIISDIATRASSADDDNTTKSTTLSTLQSTMSSQSGVNADEETASLVELQSTYEASAKVVSTVQTMFQSLLDAVKA